MHKGEKSNNNDDNGNNNNNSNGNNKPYGALPFSTDILLFDPIIIL